MSLFGLVVITTFAERSGYLNFIASRIIMKVRTERSLAASMVIFSAVLSMFLTNDVALFVVVPITMGIGKVIGNDIDKLVIFEAIAANVGSSLTPIGNPQNLYLWTLSDTSFMEFLLWMFPLFSVTFLILIVFVYGIFPSRKIDILSSPDMREGSNVSGKFVISLICMAVFVFMIDGSLWILSFIVPVVLFVFDRELIGEVDWYLLGIFFFIFLDFSTLSFTIPSIPAHTPVESYVAGALLSQLISNVPAAVVLSRSTEFSYALAWGVNVGGNGLLIASLANLIAIRLSKRNLQLKMHLYSLPYFLITFVVMGILAIFMFPQ